MVLVLADDLGFGNVGWTRAANNCSTPEVQTPVLDALVADGIELTRFYAYHMCSPSRSSLMSGRVRPPAAAAMLNARFIFLSSTQLILRTPACVAHASCRCM